MKSSIRGSILRLSLSGLILCAICIGGFGIYCVNSFTESNARDYIELIGKKESLRIDAKLSNIEQYVKTLTYVVLDGLDDIDELRDVKRQEAYTEQNLNFMQSTIRNVSNAVAVYLRYNPSYTPPTSGVFLAKTSKISSIQKQVPTDFSKYQSSDVEHVGWYFVPLRSGLPMWMEPYENKNIDIYMISYVVPLFKFGQGVGVVGVDLDFDYLTQEIAEIKVLKSGIAYLENIDGKIVYHPTIKRGNEVKKNPDNVYVRNRLLNDMVLVIEVPRSEINGRRDTLIVQILLFTIIILALFTVISIRISKSITRPLGELTDIANQMTSGNLDVNFDTSVKNEIGELSRSFDNARKSMKENLSYVRGIAYKDSLTSVRNKMAFDHYCVDLQENVNLGIVTEYAVVMFDVNNLKDVNDTLGHEFGNKLLQNACRMICKTFEHSVVFRVGGDEFVAVMQREDFNNRDMIMHDLDKWMEEVSDAQNPWERVSIAKGMADYDASCKEKVSEVISRADEAMYANKKAMKATRRKF